MSLRQFTAVFIVFAAWSACQSPVDRLRKLQLEFFRARPQPATYAVVAEDDTLQLPLPGRPEDAAQLRQLAESFRPRARAVDAAKLDAAAQLELGRFQQLLDSLALGPGLGRAPDPARYALDDLLLHFIGRERPGRHPGLVTALVEALPDYYQRIEAAWQPADTAVAGTAARRAVVSLDLLTQLEGELGPYSIGYRERLQRGLPAARYAVKDFIGLCESAKLE